MERAITSAKRELIHDPIEHCLDGSLDAKSAIKEIKTQGANGSATLLAAVIRSR